MLTYGQATNSYLQGDGSVVIVEGEAAQVLNFDTGELLYRAGSERLEWSLSMDMVVVGWLEGTGI